MAVEECECVGSGVSIDTDDPVTLIGNDCHILAPFRRRFPAVAVAVAVAVAAACWGHRKTDL